LKEESSQKTDETYSNLVLKGAVSQKNTFPEGGKKKEENVKPEPTAFQKVASYWAKLLPGAGKKKGDTPNRRKTS